MQFTYRGYRGLLQLLRENKYTFTNYHEYEAHQRCVILRHDIDNSISQAVRLAEVEAEAGVRSTWFLLLRTDFYNPASASSLKGLRYMQGMGHEIGLHFDEALYPGETLEQIAGRILHEKDILSDILQVPVTTVSMHRPSKAMLAANLQINGMVNSYGQTFFNDFKYLSDSRCRWREPVEHIVRSGEYDRLHILTHAFWYHEQEQNLTESVGAFIGSAKDERYTQLMDNITDLSSILSKEDI